MRFELRGFVLVTCLASLGAWTPARAAGPTPAAPHGSEPTQAQQDEARARFQRSLELADDGDFDAALEELRRAYELAPSYRLLYNTGLVYQQLKQYAASYDAFERYLREGGADVPAARVDDVKRRMERLAGRIAYVVVTTTDPGAEVLVDDVAEGKTPFDHPLRVNSGQRKVTIHVAGRAPESRVVDLAGGETKTVAFDLRIAAAPPASHSSPVPWISWGVTGALAVGATVTGVLALNQASSYDALSSSAPGENLSSSWQKLHTLSLTTDILLGATIVGAAVSIYFTAKPPGSGGAHGQEAAVVVAPGVVAGVF